MQRSQIFVQNRVFCLPYLHSTPQLGVPVGISPLCLVWKKIEWWVGLPDGEKNVKICLFVLTWSTNVTDRQTDTQIAYTDTAWRHRPRLCIASRGKNRSTFDNVMRDIFLTPDVYSQLLLYVFAERCYASVAFAVMRCLSVCVFVTFLHSVKTNKYLHFFHRRVATPF